MSKPDLCFRLSITLCAVVMGLKANSPEINHGVWDWFGMFITILICAAIWTDRERAA